MSDDIWQRFTQPATRVVHYAQEEAKRLGNNAVGTEHILLGLVREGDSVAGRVLEKLGVTQHRVRAEVSKDQGGLDRWQGSQPAGVSWSPKAKRVLQLALDEARELNPKLDLPCYIDTEHLLLGLIREGEGQAVRILRSLGVDLDRVRREVIAQLGGQSRVACQTGRAGAETPGGRMAAASLGRGLQHPQRDLWADVASELPLLVGAALVVIGAWIILRCAPLARSEGGQVVQVT